jgi:hypothetical protein
MWFTCLWTDRTAEEHPQYHITWECAHTLPEICVSINATIICCYYYLIAKESVQRNCVYLSWSVVGRGNRPIDLKSLSRAWIKVQQGGHGQEPWKKELTLPDYSVHLVLVCWSHSRDWSIQLILMIDFTVFCNYEGTSPNWCTPPDQGQWSRDIQAHTKNLNSTFDLIGFKRSEGRP